MQSMVRGLDLWYWMMCFVVGLKEAFLIVNTWILLTVLII